VCTVSGFESGRRLCLLAEVGGTGFALEATSIVEVAMVAEEATVLRGQLPLVPLLERFGAPAGPPGTVAVVLDVSPTLTVRMERVAGVVDVGRAPFFLLPPWLGEGLIGRFRGALVHDGRLYLELAAEALVEDAGPARAPSLPTHWLAEAPDRALIFRAGNSLYGVPLALAGQVVPLQPPSLARLPVQEGPVMGLYSHASALWPVCHPGRLAGGEGGFEDHLIFTEPAGQGVALSAGEILGVVDGLLETDRPGAFVGPGMQSPALFLDLPRMFS